MAAPGDAFFRKAVPHFLRKGDRLRPSRCTGAVPEAVRHAKICPPDKMRSAAHQELPAACQELPPGKEAPSCIRSYHRIGSCPLHKALPPHGALSSAPDYRRSSSTSSGTPSVARLRMTVSGLRMPDTSGLPGSTR